MKMRDDNTRGRFEEVEDAYYKEYVWIKNTLKDYYDIEETPDKILSFIDKYHSYSGIDDLLLLGCLLARIRRTIHATLLTELIILKEEMEVLFDFEEE